MHPLDWYFQSNSPSSSNCITLFHKPILEESRRENLQEMGLADLGEYSIIKSKHTNRSAWPLSGGPVSERRELSMTKKERARLAVNALKMNIRMQSVPYARKNPYSY